MVRLEPIGGNVFWVAGRPATAGQDRGVRVAAAFDQQVRSMLAVRVEIENETDHRVDVDPAKQFSFVSCRSASERSCAGETFVVDPEDVIAYLDQTASREQARATDDGRAAGALWLLTAASSFSPSNGDASAPALNAAARHDRAADDAAAERDMWSTVALRHTTVAPGGSTVGQVFIPIDHGVQTVWLRVRVGNRIFPFHFQEVTQPVSRAG